MNIRSQVIVRVADVKFFHLESVMRETCFSARTSKEIAVSRSLKNIPNMFQIRMYCI